MSKINNLVGQSHIFPDGYSITVTQVKIRDGNIPWVTFNLKQGPGIERREVMQIDQFVDSFGHLFDIKNDDIDFPSE